MTERNKYLIAGAAAAAAIAIAAWAFWPKPAAAADVAYPHPNACTPAFTTGKYADDFGAQVAAAFLFIPMAAMTATAYAVATPAEPLLPESMIPSETQRFRMLCSTVAVGIHAAKGAKKVVQTPAKGVSTVGGAVYNIVQPTP